MSTITETDLAALVGEMEAPACEHSQHGTGHSMHGGEATHYVRAIHKCAPPSHAYAACERMVLAITSRKLFRCGACGKIDSLDQAFEILGPVNK